MVILVLLQHQRMSQGPPVKFRKEFLRSVAAIGERRSSFPLLYADVRHVVSPKVPNADLPPDCPLKGTDKKGQERKIGSNNN